MKKSLFVITLCTLLMSACHFDSVTINGGRRIAPSENIVKHEYAMKAFDEIDVDVIANVKIIQSESGDSRVVLRAPDNYVDLFKFSVSDHKLSVRFTRSNINIEARDVDVTIYTPTLRELENDGVANIEIDRLRTDELDVDNSGVGSMFLYGLDVRELDADCSGVGSIELKGRADEASLDCSGVGSIKASQLVARRVKGDVSGVGGIQCHATDELEADVSGVGSLKYQGSPKSKKINRSGVGKVDEM